MKARSCCKEVSYDLKGGLFTWLIDIIKLSSMSSNTKGLNIRASKGSAALLSNSFIILIFCNT